MKQLFSLLLVVSGLFVQVLSVSAQYKVQYDYDAAGNRIARTVISFTPPPIGAAPKHFEPLKQIWGERKIIVYPNPTKGVLKINISNGALNQEYTTKVYDQNGKIVSTEKRNGDGDIIVNLSVQASGVYILVLTAGSEEKTYKIVKE